MSWLSGGAPWDGAMAVPPSSPHGRGEGMLCLQPGEQEVGRRNGETTTLQDKPWAAQAYLGGTAV